MKIRCKLCNNILDTNTDYDLVYCSCGAVAVDGGDEYHRIIGWKNAWEYVESKGDDKNE